jgi:tRNA(adenine34) deaminase
MSDAEFMAAAMEEAAAAAAAGEVPVGAVAVRDGVIVARGRNCVEQRSAVDGHAEFDLMRNLCAVTGDWRLEPYDIYVTKEPCFMCSGMLINARAKRIVFGFSDSAAGGCGGALDLCAHPGNLWHPEVVSGVLAEETLAQFRIFFKEVRKKKKKSLEK